MSFGYEEGDYDDNGDSVHTTKRKLEKSGEYKKREVLEALVETVESMKNDIQRLEWRVEDLEKELGK